MSLVADERQLAEKSWDTARIAGWLRAKRLLWERHRQPYERLFLQCLRFWAGDQWRDIIESIFHRWDTRQIKSTVTEDFRLVDNQVPPYCRWLTAQATQNMPRLKARPRNRQDPEDIYSAQLSTAYLEQRHYADLEEQKRELEWLWMLGTGEVLRRTIFNAEGGSPGVGEGDVLSEVVDPFRYLKDPWGDPLKPSPLFISEARHVDWIKEKWGIAVEQEDLADTQVYYDMLAMNVLLSGTDRRQRETIKNAAFVDQFYIPPGPKYPDGWLFVRVRDTIVQSAPLQAGIWPFSLGGWYPMIGRLYPMGLIELMMGDQRQLNLLQSILFEAACKQNRGDMTIIGMIPDPRVARGIVYNPATGAKITPLPPGVQFVPTNYGADWTQGETRREQIDRNIHRKAGVHEPSLGQPASVEQTATAFSGNREADLQVSRFHLSRYSRFHLTAIATQKIRLAQAFYLLPRELEGVGDSKEFVLFQGADLSGTKDVIAEPAPAMSEETKQRARMEAYGAKLRGPYESLEHRYAAWLTLRGAGLQEMVEEMEPVYGTFADLEKRVQAKSELMEKAEFAQVMAGMQQLMMGAGGAPAQGGANGGSSQTQPTAAA